MKAIKFKPHLCSKILDRKKTATWRLFDDKNISNNDILAFINSETHEEFAKAIVLSVKEIKLGKVAEQDFEEHEQFASNEDMLNTFSRYYNCNVDGNTDVKIIKFKLI